MSFELGKYLGHWYDIGHYPTWYQPASTYNTSATYNVHDGHIVVHNKTHVLLSDGSGEQIESYGFAVPISPGQFEVRFPETERAKLANQFGTAGSSTSGVNYIVEKIWQDPQSGDYKYAIVTNPDKSNMWILSRRKNPPHWEFAEIQAYLYQAGYDMGKIVYTIQV